MSAHRFRHAVASTVLAVPAACIAFMAAVVVAAVARDFPQVGHDYRYFIPRLIDTDLHLRLNGPSVQWYTPTFGGGLPAYPNPQHIEYSLLQAATYLVNPWSAVLLTTALVCAVGGAAFYRFLRIQLVLDRMPSALGTVFFLGNGFFIEHMIVGHVGFQLFPLVAVMLDALTDTRRSVIASGAALGLAVALMVHQAGFFLVILLAMSLAIALPVVALYRPETVVARQILAVVAIGAALAIAMTASKIHATLSLLALVPREITDTPGVGIAAAGLGFLTQLFGVMTLAPALLLAGLDLGLMASLLSKLTGASVRIGIWELDTAVSPVAALVLTGGLLQRMSVWRAGGMGALRRDQKVAIALLVLASWLVTEATLARGLIYPFVKSLPILRSLHVNHRFAAAFIVPIATAAAVELNRWYGGDRARWVVPAIVAVTLAAPLTYLALPSAVSLRTFDVRQSIADYTSVRSGETFPITRIADVEDEAAFAHRASSLRTYEPLFGYDLATFASHTWAGDVHEVRDGAFNMTNPASLVFPSLNGVRPSDRIPETERGRLDLFTSRRQPEWVKPPVQDVLTKVAAAGVALSLACLFAGRRRADNARASAMASGRARAPDSQR